MFSSSAGDSEKDSRFDSVIEFKNTANFANLDRSTQRYVLDPRSSVQKSQNLQYDLVFCSSKSVSNFYFRKLNLLAHLKLDVKTQCQLTLEVQKNNQMI